MKLPYRAVTTTVSAAIVGRFTLAIVGWMILLAAEPRELFAIPIPLGGGGVFNASNMTGGVLAITSIPPCIAFSGASTCTFTTGIDLSGIDPIFGASGTIKDIGTLGSPITSFMTANLTIGGGPAIFDLENFINPTGILDCSFSQPVSGSCLELPLGSSHVVLTQTSPTQVSIAFSTNEIGYLGSSLTGSTPYIGNFTTQLSGGLAQFGCLAFGAQTCTDTIANISIFEAPAFLTTAAGLGAIGQGGKVTSTWMVTESPATSTSATPEPISLVLFGSGLAGVALCPRRFCRR